MQGLLPAKGVLVCSCFTILVCGLFGVRESFASDCNEVIPSFIQSVGEMPRESTILISFESKTYSGRRSFGVEAKVRGLPKGFSVLNLTTLEFELYQLGKSEEGEILYLEGFDADCKLSGKTQAELMKGSPVTLQLDLAKLGWTNQKSSIRGLGNPLNTLPPGRYLLWMSARFVDAKKSSTAKDGAHGFFSNKIEFEITGY